MLTPRHPKGARSTLAWAAICWEDRLELVNEGRLKDHNAPQGYGDFGQRA